MKFHGKSFLVIMRFICEFFWSAATSALDYTAYGKPKVKLEARRTAFLG